MIKILIEKLTKFILNMQNDFLYVISIWRAKFNLKKRRRRRKKEKENRISTLHRIGMSILL